MLREMSVATHAGPCRARCVARRHAAPLLPRLPTRRRVCRVRAREDPEEPERPRALRSQDDEVMASEESAEEVPDANGGKMPLFRARLPSATNAAALWRPQEARRRRLALRLFRGHLSAWEREESPPPVDALSRIASGNEPKEPGLMGFSLCTPEPPADRPRTQGDSLGWADNLSRGSVTGSDALVNVGSSSSSSSSGSGSVDPDGVAPDGGRPRRARASREDDSLYEYKLTGAPASSARPGAEGALAR